MRPLIIIILTVAPLAGVVIGQKLKPKDIYGLWAFTSTPIEFSHDLTYWIRLEESGHYQTGYGRLQVESGHWKLDKQKVLTTFQKDGKGSKIKEYQIQHSDNKMKWEDLSTSEQSELVIIHELPYSLSDQLVGIWQLSDAIKDGQSITGEFDPAGHHYLELRWDRLYVGRSPQGKRITGFWYASNYRPEITLISHQSGEASETWKVEFKDSELFLSGSNYTNEGNGRTYTRIFETPE